MPAELDFSIYRGDTVRWVFALWQDAANTIPIDLNNVTAKAEIRDQPGGNLITAFDLAITLPNEIYMTLTSENSHLLSASGGVWDLQLTYYFGDVITILAGTVAVTMDVTDSNGDTVSPGATVLSLPAPSRLLVTSRFKQRA